ncbi:MAG: histidine phosphatase family protein [Thermoleophilaceae bacterium]
MRRLLLLRHATTPAVRRSAFPLDEPLDAAGEASASALHGRLGRGDALSSPALRARATATAAGLDAVAEPALAECDFGSWAGRTLAEVWESEPADAEAWMTDPGAAPHGGESLLALLERIGRWLDSQAARDGRCVAITHGGVVKAAVVHALGADPLAFWRVDATPLHVTELHGRDGRWTLAAANAPVVAARADAGRTAA